MEVGSEVEDAVLAKSYLLFFIVTEIAHSILGVRKPIFLVKNVKM